MERLKLNEFEKQKISDRSKCNTVVINAVGSEEKEAHSWNYQWILWSKALLPVIQFSADTRPFNIKQIEHVTSKNFTVESRHHAHQAACTVLK